MFVIEKTPASIYIFILVFANIISGARDIWSVSRESTCIQKNDVLLIIFIQNTREKHGDIRM